MSSESVMLYLSPGSMDASLTHQVIFDAGPDNTHSNVASFPLTTVTSFRMLSISTSGTEERN